MIDPIVVGIFVWQKHSLYHLALVSLLPLLVVVFPIVETTNSDSLVWIRKRKWDDKLVEQILSWAVEKKSEIGDPLRTHRGNKYVHTDIQLGRCWLAFIAHAHFNSLRECRSIFSVSETHLAEPKHNSLVPQFELAKLPSDKRQYFTKDLLHFTYPLPETLSLCNHYFRNMYVISSERLAQQDHRKSKEGVTSICRMFIAVEKWK